MRSAFKEFVSWLVILVIPSLFTMLLYCIRYCEKYTKQLKVLAKAQQDHMRSQLLEQYHKYMKDGYISEEHMEDWENQYQAYHSLGENGILDNRRNTLLKLPSVPK